MSGYLLRFLILSLFLIAGCKSQQLELNFSSTNDTNGSIQIVGSPTLTNTRAIPLFLNSNKATQMALFGGACDAKNATWETYSSSRTFNLPGSDGLRKISVLFRDDNKFQSECYSTEITLDTVAPTQPGAIVFATTIAGKFATPKMAFTASTDVTTSVSSYEARLLKSPSLDEVAIWTDVSLNNINSQITGLTLTENQDYVVEVRAKDAAGNYSDARRSSVFRAGPFLSITVNSSTLQPGIYKVRFELSSLASQLVSFNYSTEEITAKTGYHFKQLSGTGNITIGKYYYDVFLEVLGYPFYDGNPGSTRSLKVNVTNITNAGANDDYKTVTVEHLATKPQMQNIAQLSLSGNTFCALSIAGNTFCGGTNNSTYFYLGKPLAESDLGYITRHTDVSNAKFVTVSNKGGCLISGAQNALSCWGGGSLQETGKTWGLSTVTPLSFTDVSVVGLSNYHGCFINNSGQLFCSGSNWYYQQGHTGANTTVFTYVGSGFTGVTKLQLGDYSTCMIQSSKVYCFGYNNSGLIGLPLTTTQTEVPTQVGSLTSATDLSVYFETACAINAGQVYCWGRNSSFILGNSVETNNYNPQLITLPGSVSKVDVGASHACAIIDQTKVYCWGNNEYAAFGNTNYVGDLTTPVLVYTANENLTSIEVGSGLTCVLGSSKVPKCWGKSLGYLGGLRNLSLTNPHYPVFANLGLGSFKAIDARRNLMCALTTTSKLYCWGLNPFSTVRGQMSVGLLHQYAPKLMFNGNRISKFAIGINHVCGILESTSQVVCIGKNDRGQLGTGNTTDSMTPIAAVGVSGATSIAIAGDSTCALQSDGSMKCWGDNSYLKNGVTTNFSDGSYATNMNITPVAVPWLGVNGSEIVGYDNTFCVLKKGLTVMCWGLLAGGEGGDPNISMNGIPNYDVDSNTAVSQLWGGSFGFCSQNASGSLKCWGTNYTSRFGTASSEDAVINSATVISGVSSVLDLSIGTFTLCAIDSDSTVKCLGQGSRGIVGPTSASNYRSFQAIPNIEGGVSKIAQIQFTDLPTPNSSSGSLAYTFYDGAACALTNSGELVCWGLGLGNLGIGATLDGLAKPVVRPEVFTPYYEGD